MKGKPAEKIRRELRAGMYALVTLAILKKEEMHGYAIRKKFEELSNGKIKPSEGAMYDILKKIEKMKLVESFWAKSSTGRIVKCYKLSEKGEKVLNELKEEVKAIISILEVVL